MDIDYRLSLNVLKALGGNTDVPYESVEEIWDTINGIYDNAGDRLDIQALILDIKNNGLYEYYPSENADAYAPVRLNVNVPQKYTEEYIQELEKSVFQEGYNEGNEEGYKNGYTAGNTDGYTDGYAEGLDDGTEQQKALLEETTFKDNGVYEKEDGWNKVTVEVDIPTFETETLLVELTENGDYNYTPSTDGYESVGVSVRVPVPTFTTEPLGVELRTNGTTTYTPPAGVDGFSSVSVTVDVQAGGDGGKPKIYNGFRLFPKGADFSSLSKVDFSQYDWSGVYDLSKFFSGFLGNSMGGMSAGNFNNFIENFNGKILSLNNAFEKYTGGYHPLSGTPNFGELTKDCVDFNQLFDTALNLRYVNISGWNTSNVLTMRDMFGSSSNLTTVEDFDTSNVIDMYYMFYGCSVLTSIPHLDTSKVRDMRYIFAGCKALTTIPQLDTSKVMYTESMFNNCTSLTSVPLLDFGNVIEAGSIFGTNYLTKLTDVGGFKDFGKPLDMTINANYQFNYMTNLTHESIMNIINNLYDRAAAGYLKYPTLNFGSTNLNKLTDEEKAVATRKGWTLK